MTFLAQAAAATAEAPTIALTPGVIGLLTLFATVVLSLVEIVKRLIAEKWPVHRAERAGDHVEACRFTPEAKAGLEAVSDLMTDFDNDGRRRWLVPAKRFDDHDQRTLEILSSLSRSQSTMAEVLVELKQRPCPIGKDVRP